MAPGADPPIRLKEVQEHSSGGLRGADSSAGPVAGPARSPWRGQADLAHRQRALPARRPACATTRRRLIRAARYARRDLGFRLRREPEARRKSPCVAWPWSWPGQDPAWHRAALGNPACAGALELLAGAGAVAGRPAALAGLGRPGPARWRASRPNRHWRRRLALGSSLSAFPARGFCWPGQRIRCVAERLQLPRAQQAPVPSGCAGGAPGEASWPGPTGAWSPSRWSRCSRWGGTQRRWPRGPGRRQRPRRPLACAGGCAGAICADLTAADLLAAGSRLARSWGSAAPRAASGSIAKTALGLTAAAISSAAQATGPSGNEAHLQQEAVSPWRCLWRCRPGGVVAAAPKQVMAESAGPADGASGFGALRHPDAPAVVSAPTAPVAAEA